MWAMVRLVYPWLRNTQSKRRMYLYGLSNLLMVGGRNFWKEILHIAYDQVTLQLRVRMDVVNEENMRNYFDQLKKVFDEGDFWNHLEAIYNLDKTGVPLESRPPKVVALKGQKKGLLSDLWSEAANYSEWLCNCYWSVSPSLHKFCCQEIRPLMVNEVSGTRHAYSEKGR